MVNSNGEIKMLEISHSCREWLTEGEPMPKQESSLRDRAVGLCRDYLRGSWLAIQPDDMVFQKVSGGLSNLLYYCALPEGMEATNGEPVRLLLRLYGHENKDHAMETVITESVIFTLLSESQRGPRLYGVFPGGRLEEYIEARPLRTQELSNLTLSALIADKMAQIHLMDVPINKQPRRPWNTMEGWLKQIKEFLKNKSYLESSQQMMDTLEKLDLYEEYLWLKDYIANVKSPVVFCHNDLQEGNILLRNKNNIKGQKICLNNITNMTDYEDLTSDSLVIIDFEYCSYNYRGFDFSNHFCEWVYDYSNDEPPYFWQIESNQPDNSQKEYFIECYLKALKNNPEYKPRPEDNVQSLMKEVEAYTLVSHFFWALWSVINSTSSEITFDYWGYGHVRFQAYYSHKKSLLAQHDT